MRNIVNQHGSQSAFLLPKHVMNRNADLCAVRRTPVHDNWTDIEGSEELSTCLGMPRVCAAVN